MKRPPRMLSSERAPFFLMMALLAWSSGACEPSVAGPALTHPCVSWCNTVAPWPHDGNPYESGHFTLYSDGVSHQVLAEVATIAEAVLADLKVRFEIPSDELFVLPANQTKIHMYVYRYHYPTQWGGQGFFGGLIIYSLDHPERTRLGHTEVGNYTRLMTHELTHVTQNLLVGSTHSYSTHTWFEEGLAELVSALNPERSVLNLTDLNALTARYGELNPIAIRNDVYPATANVALEYFYPMFELTARYLLDDRGLNHSLLDAKAVFLDMRGGMSFPDGFAANFGLSVAELEAQYFDRIRAYLR